MSKLEARANPRVSRFSRDRKNLRLTGEKCTGRAGGPSMLLGGGWVGFASKEEKTLLTRSASLEIAR